MFVTSADLPIDGRAAMMIRLPGWKPPVIASRSAKPDGVPVSERPSAESSCHLRDLGVQDLADAAEVLLAVVVGDLEDRRARPTRRARAAAPRGRGRSAWIS